MIFTHEGMTMRRLFLYVSTNKFKKPLILRSAVINGFLLIKGTRN